MSDYLSKENKKLPLTFIEILRTIPMDRHLVIYYKLFIVPKNRNISYRNLQNIWVYISLLSNMIDII